MTLYARFRSGSISALLATAALSACVINGTYFETGSRAGLSCTGSIECGAGLHCAMESGAGVCRDESTSVSDASVGTAVSGAACTGASDCASGLECDFEQGAGICRQRGASTNPAATSVTGACVSNTDCSAGQLCDFSGGAGVCRTSTVSP
jgi:hypothetical protein